MSLKWQIKEGDTVMSFLLMVMVTTMCCQSSVTLAHYGKCATVHSRYEYFSVWETIQFVIVHYTLNWKLLPFRKLLYCKLSIFHFTYPEQQYIILGLWWLVTLKQLLQAYDSPSFFYYFCSSVRVVNDISSGYKVLQSKRSVFANVWL